MTASQITRADGTTVCPVAALIARLETVTTPGDRDRVIAVLRAITGDMSVATVTDWYDAILAASPERVVDEEAASIETLDDTQTPALRRVGDTDPGSDVEQAITAELGDARTAHAHHRDAITAAFPHPPTHSPQTQRHAPQSSTAQAAEQKEAQR